MGDGNTLAPDQIASGFLPGSLFELLESKKSKSGEPIPVVIAVLRTGQLFSIENNQGDVGGRETTVGSPVVSLTVGVNQTFTNLLDPIIVNVRILVKVSLF